MFNVLLVVLFLLGYLLIAMEHKIGINKAATALCAAVFCWLVNFANFYHNDEPMIDKLNVHLADITQIVIYLLAAMVIVELIEAHQGFRYISDLIHATNKRALLWIIAAVTFALSAFLVNMTTAIVMIALTRRFITDRNERLIFAVAIIVASNAGGAWTPIGDSTTTMLWIGGQISTAKVVTFVFLPSLISMLIPLGYFTRMIPNEAIEKRAGGEDGPHYGAKAVLAMGVVSLISVPVLTEVTHIPPHMGIMLMLGLMWVFTDLIQQERHFLRVPHVLTRVDISSVLFFLGILLMVAALESVGLLKAFAYWLERYFASKNIIIGLMGAISSIVDNVPVTAAAMGMYSLKAFPVNSWIWEMTAYCVGTGGSILIIGSAPGVIAMAMEKLTFGWYMRKASIPILLGYLAGIGVIIFEYRLVGITG